MKAVLIGSDFILDGNGNVKLIETNTNASIYDSMINELDYSGLISLIQTNSITELVYIYSSEHFQHDTNFSIGVDLDLDKKLAEIASGSGISYDKYQVNYGSITVPYIEDTPTKLIIRQAYDGTALIDETYCANKANLQELIKDEDYAIPTLIDTNDVNVNTLIELAPTEPNIVVKSIHPAYDGSIYPQLHTLNNLSELETLKASIPNDYFIQQFINADENILNGKYSIIRSFDLIYGSNLDTIHLGSYTNTAVIELSVWGDEYVNNTSVLTNKSRVRWINKKINTPQRIHYNIDEETVIVNDSGSYIGVSDISVGTKVKSLDFSNLEANTLDYIDLDLFTSSFEETQNSLEMGTADVVSFKSESFNGLVIHIETADLNAWDDVVGSTYYVQLSGSNVTKFKKSNYLQVGDEIITLDNDNNTLSKVAITLVTPNFVENKMIYEVDVEDKDLFLSVLDEIENTSIIQHNPCWCSGMNCGTYACPNYCTECTPSCFTGDALISTPNGQRRIDEINEGDEVLSYDFDNNIIIHATVTGLWKNQYDNGLVIINGIETKATMGHPFAVKDINGNVKWACYDNTFDSEFHVGLDIENLKLGEHYVYLDGVWVLVEDIQLQPFTGIVYNLSVENVHNYIAENLLVHNVIDKLQKPN
jgi:hypothetical protein